MFSLRRVHVRAGHLLCCRPQEPINLIRDRRQHLETVGQCASSCSCGPIWRGTNQRKVVSGQWLFPLLLARGQIRLAHSQHCSGSSSSHLFHFGGRPFSTSRGARFAGPTACNLLLVKIKVCKLALATLATPTTCSPAFLPHESFFLSCVIDVCSRCCCCCCSRELLKRALISARPDANSFLW